MSFCEPAVVAGLAAFSVPPDSFGFEEESEDELEAESPDEADAGPDFSPFDSEDAESPPDFRA